MALELLVVLTQPCQLLPLLHTRPSELSHAVVLSMAEGGVGVAPALCTAWSLPHALRNANYPTDSDLLLHAAHIGFCRMQLGLALALHLGTSWKEVALLWPASLSWPEMRLDQLLI